MSFDNPRYGRIADSYARELICEVHDFISTCGNQTLRREAQHLVEQIRFSEITLASAEYALANLEIRYNETLENEE